MTLSNKMQTHRSGYVALVGRPNAGKSTLLNQLVGQKIAAVSDKPQTTRFKIQGVITKPEGQIVLVDTPGVHKPGFEMNRRMMATVQDALLGVDLVCLIRDASVSTGNGDKFVLELIQRSKSLRSCCSTRPTNSKTSRAVAADRVVPQRIRLARDLSRFRALHGNVIDALPDADDQTSAARRAVV